MRPRIMELIEPKPLILPSMTISNTTKTPYSDATQVSQDSVEEASKVIFRLSGLRASSSKYTLPSKLPFIWL